MAGASPALAQTSGAVKLAAKKGKSDTRPVAKTANDAVPAAEPYAPPKPFKPPSAEEARSNAVYDAAIAEVRDRPADPEVAARLRDALARIAAGDISGARLIARGTGSATAETFVDWVAFRSGGGTAAELRAFSDSHPAWPDRVLIAQRAEEALFNSAASPAEVKAFFAKSEPRTAVGLAMLASALQAEKDLANARAAAQKAWTEFNISHANEPAFLRRVGSLLTDADHKRRLERLLAGTGRLAGARAERGAVIKRTIALLSSAEDRKTYETRLGLFLQSKDASKLAAKIPSTHADWGAAVQKARQLRRQKKEEEAWKILLSEPDATVDIKPDGWWEERRTSAYAALRIGRPQVAYDLVRNMGALSINATKDAQFLAGWIALRHLKDAKTALGHFQALCKAADGPLSNARGQYWLGRTYEALGEQAKAGEAYRTAAAYFDTFHGQLARLKVEPTATTLKIRPPAAPTAEDIASFKANGAVAAAVFARKANVDISLVRAFFNHLRYQLKSEGEVAMLAHLALALGDTQSAVRVGKIGIARGFQLAYYAYPISGMPEYKPLRDPPEPAFLYGIARQESEFNTLTMSHVGARGILQVMPVTAKHVCNDYKIKCDIPRLMKDPAYNTMMGSAYIGDRMEEFDGSYVLTLAGYNAGPGRARQWIKEFGDPRDPKVDPIDWIHRIPFEETREYVQKVLSNIQVYRARLGDEPRALRLASDLRRVAPAKAKE
ncbi:MAG: lytic transglycosylase domain-containing protein [Hyphomicrobiaceae bacterium]|nr:lytic transglycosylase domain-containing protein [Hyphomicrobiaceae bacterium]